MELNPEQTDVGFRVGMSSLSATTSYIMGSQK